jgi:hypothetical protein
VSVVLFGSYSVFLHCFRFCWLDFSFPLRGSVLPQVHSVPIGFSEASRRSFFPCCFSTHFLLARRQGFVAVPDFFFVRSTVAWGHFQQIGTSRSISPPQQVARAVLFLSPAAVARALSQVRFVALAILRRSVVLPA